MPAVGLEGGERMDLRDAKAMSRIFLLVALIILAVSGCAGIGKVQDSNPPFSEHLFHYYDLEVKWRAERSDGSLRLVGTVRNVRDLFLQDLELTARLLDRQGKVVARDSFWDFPDYLPPGQAEPFHLQLRLPPGEQAKEIHFSYYYFPVEAPPAFGGQEYVPKFGGFVSPP